MSKFSILIFDRKMDFTVWKMTIEDMLIQQGIDEALEEEQPTEMKDDVWKTMQKKASSTIRLALAPEIKYIGLSNLSKCNDAIKDEEQALLMLSSLPKSYKPFVQTMLTGRTTLTFEDVLKALRDNERMTGNDRILSSDKLLLQMTSVRVEIFQRNSKEKKKVDGGEMNVVDNGGDEFLKTETSMYGILREEKTKWVLDNAASSHICNDRAMFETLNGKGQFGEIKMGSKQMMKIEGVGSVPGAARNILSLGVLTSRKVYKRDQLVIRGRKILNNLCYLEGEALQGMTFCGGNKGKKKIEKRVHFLDKDEVLGILSQGRIY
ncbi:hypothetical protein Tco_0000168 [Tanacetum coccineum]